GFPLMEGNGGARHPSQPLLALPVGNSVRLIDVSPPDAVERGYRAWRARFDPVWQEEQARKHEAAKDWFTPAFQWGQIAQHGPGAGPHWRKLVEACAGAGTWRRALAFCERLLRQDPTLAPVWFRRARLRANLLQFHEAAADQLTG